MTHDMAETVEVDCTFRADGRVIVRRVRIDGRWLPAEQGRQGEDAAGRFVLVMLAGGPVRQLRLDRESLRWSLTDLPGDVNQNVV